MSGMKASWWERMKAHLFGRRIAPRCLRCDRVLDLAHGMKLPRGTRSVCFGVIDLAEPGEAPRLTCIGASVRHG